MLDGLKALWILEINDNKKLQLEDSPRVVHKRSTSQNMPIWEHKRSSSVILSYTQSDFGGQIQTERRTMSQEGNERRGGRNKVADRGGK